MVSLIGDVSANSSKARNVLNSCRKNKSIALPELNPAIADLKK